MFSYEFCKISKNTFFTEHLRTTAYVTNLTVFRVAFVYHSKADIQSYSVKYSAILQLFS